jgi:hypothetical protein
MLQINYSNYHLEGPVWLSFHRKFVGKNNTNSSKLIVQIIVDCGIHAREWVSPAFCQYLIKELLFGDHQDWKNDIHWVIYPMFNPDGYKYSWTDYRYQRKNRAPNAGSNCVGKVPFSSFQVILSAFFRTKLVRSAFLKRHKILKGSQLI